MNDEHWMRLALAEARTAADEGEVPVGAVLVRDGVLLASGHNRSIAAHDPSAHAEIDALRAGAAAVANHRLDGCELFVTLEPCAMCAGAVLHARLARLVYGAPDPKTGAAGSVLNLFEPAQLNHRTRVRGGVLASECGVLLQAFFSQRRADARAGAQPLRDDALRTPESAFATLGAPAPGRYLSDLPALHGWRLHYQDTGPPGADRCLVCLHGAGQWSYLWRHLLALPCRTDTVRLLAPDLIGHGRSDKPKRPRMHTIEWHARVLAEWMERLDLRAATIVHDPQAAALVAALKALAPERVVAALAASLVVAPESAAAWAAPFPDTGHEAALRALGPRRLLDLPPCEARVLARSAMGYCAP